MPSAKAQVLDVGNCSPDHGMIRQMLTKHFDVDIDCVMFVDEALAKMREKNYSLVLFNRLIFADGSPGIELLQKAKADGRLADTPMMMVSNYARAHQDAVAAGAEPGFGKAELFDPRTISLLSNHLPKKEGSAGAQGSD